MEGSQYLQRLLRYFAVTPEVTAAGVAMGEQSRFAELDLYLTVPDGVLPELLPGDLAYAGADQIITADGLTIRLHLNTPFPPAAQVLVGRPPSAATEDAPGLPDLATAAAAFWRDLYHAAAAIGMEEPFTAHSRLERCREGLINLYRIALQPARPGQGWEGAEALPGARKVLDGVAEWLVQPLEPRAQWRGAHRLAGAYERLMLPLAERLQFEYPWTLRNLTFKRLDEIRPDRPTAADSPVPTLRELADEPAPPRRGGPARFKVKVRREPE